jgi:hypothetical protein
MNLSLWLSLVIIISVLVLVLADMDRVPVGEELD